MHQHLLHLWFLPRAGLMPEGLGGDGVPELLPTPRVLHAARGALGDVEGAGLQGALPLEPAGVRARGALSVTLQTGET